MKTKLESLEHKYFIAELCFQTTDDEERQDEYFEEMYQTGELIDQVKHDMRHNMSK